MAQQFCLDLKQIPDQETSKMVGEVLLESLVVDNVLKKQLGKDFLTKCLRNLQDEKASAELKYNTLSIFRFIDFKNKSSLKIFSMLTGHPVFAWFIETARQVDPRKSVSQKGKNLFPKSKEIGNNFMRLLLECIKFWSQRFPSNSQQQPTKYKKSFTELSKQGVTFPSSYQFYEPVGSINSEKPQKTTPGGDPIKNVKTSSNNEKQMAKVQSSGQGSGSAPQQKITKSSIMLLFNKIQSFISFLQDSESLDELSKQINKNHKMFEKEQKKLEASNVLSIEDEKIVSTYLKMNEFFLSEKQIYDEWIVKNDSMKTYVDSLFIKYDGIFAEELAEQDKPEEKPQKIAKPQPSAEESKSTIKNSQKMKNANNENSKQEKRKYESVNSQKEKEAQQKKKRQEDEDESPKVRLKQKKSNVETEQIKDKALRNFFNSHLQRPATKSLSGFKAIKESIQKEKKGLKLNVRGKSPINQTSKSKFNASTLSKIQTNNIFSKPPNPNVRSKRYDGTFVTSNYQLENAVHDIQKEQGMKRFKISNLKSRALLYESEHIQVGYKSDAIYEKIEGLNNSSQMIQLQLYIGNKTNDQIRDCVVTFLGDQKSLVYSNPQKAPETIKGGDQSIFTVIIVPCAQSYSVTTMNISYKFNSYPTRSVIVLPSSILKFVSYEKADVRDINEFQRSSSTKCYQTDKFQLSHYFAPRKIQHYIEELTETTSYTEFAQNGSEKDFVLGAFCIIKNKHSGLVKINVRPDLSVVIQLMSIDVSQEAQTDFNLYLQSLLMVLKEHR